MRALVLIALATVALPLSTSAAPGSPGTVPKDYQVEYLLSDGSIPSENLDLDFKNGWGIAASSTGPWWVAVNEMDGAKVINADGVSQSLIVSMPGSPTGIVHSDSGGFVVSDGTTSGPAVFLFALENGTITGWNPNVGPPAPLQQAFVGVNRSDVGADYKGLAIAQTGAGTRLYATDFHNGRIDVFDESFNLVSTSGFVDPKLPRGYAPFGIQALAGRIFVSYAKQDADAADEVAGNGLGAVNVFDTDGNLIAQVGIHGQLNAPWGMAIAPAGFGPASGKLLVGNFGDGSILVYSMTDDMKKFTPGGVLRDASHKQIQIDGLWGIGFGNGGAAGSPNALYFAAGPADETHGSFGRVTITPTP